MARKPYNTTVEETVSAKFKEACNASGIGMNIILEALMQGFAENKFIITLVDGKFKVKAKDY